MKNVFGRTYTDECAPKGDGNCDGYEEATSAECECNCHGTPNLPDTVAEVEVWHDEMWGTFAK